MKLFCMGLLLVWSTTTLRAGDLTVSVGGRELSRTPKRVWIRRATLVAGCAASLAFDTLTTRRSIAAGGVEGNSLFAGSQGRPQWGRVIALKAGLCGFSAVVQETQTLHSWQGAKSDWTWTGVNLGTTAVYTWAGFHNLKLVGELTSK